MFAVIDIPMRPQAGIQFSEIIDFADANNLTIPTGADLSVGAAGGFLQVRQDPLFYCALS